MRMILTDNETKIDLLNNEAIARTIIALLSDRPEMPITIGVHGDWGAGKSSILEMIDDQLSEQSDILCLKFNGWQFQGFEDAKIALIEGIVSGLIESQPTLTKSANAVKDVFNRINWLKVAKKAGGLAMTVSTGVPLPDQLDSVMQFLKGAEEDPSKIATKENFSQAIDCINSVLDPAEDKNVPEEIREFRKAFDQLLSEAGIKQLVVLIDDLDRCLPDTTIETLEAIRLFVFTARTAFVIAADEQMIEYAVRKHFPDLPDTTGPRDYARNYLEKLIQVPFRIPALGETETRIYVTLLLAGIEIGEDDSSFLALIDLARDRLKRPWNSAPLDAAALKTAMGSKSDNVHNALMLSEQIGPILAGGTSGNPRQIKRFLNTLILRKNTSDARGFGDDIKLPVLAKLMLAERFLPSLFDQIATVSVSHPKGICEDLKKLETACFEKAQDPQSEKTENSNSSNQDQISESTMLSEWKASDSIIAWAKIEPTLAVIDLRPYLFATKDRKDYFGPASTLGPLSIVAEKLFGDKLTVQALESELRQLAKPEAEKIFEAVRSKIMSGDTFGKKPVGIDGLVVLVKTHANLQGKLIDFLQMLPSKKCGAWIVGGWDSAIKDTQEITRLEKLLDTWSKVSENNVLQQAAKATLQTRGSKK